MALRTRTARIFAAIALAALCVFEYLPVTTAGFVYEDDSSILQTTINQQAPIAPLRTRALTRLTYRLDAAIGKGSPLPFHLTNLALHLVNGGLVWYLAANIVPGYGIVAATLFLLLPIQIEAVAYAAGRTETLSLMFILLALCALTDWLTPMRVAFSLVCLALAMSAKESAICGVAIWIAAFALFHPHEIRRWRKYVWLSVPLVAICIGLAYTVLQHEHRAVSDYSRMTYAAIQAVAFWKILFAALTLRGQTIDHDVLLQAPWVAWCALYVLLCLVALLPYLLYTGCISRATAFAYSFVILALVLRFVMRIPESLNEHQVYAASIGFCLAAAIGFRKVHLRYA